MGRFRVTLFVLASVLALVTSVALLRPAVATSSVSEGDGGWVLQQQLLDQGDVTDVTFVDASHGWAVGGSIISVTGDGGVTWTEQYSGASGEQLESVCFPDASHGWAVGSDQTANTALILVTSDGGVTWARESSGTADHLSSVCFPDNSHGWAVGWHYPSDESTDTTVVGTILATSDGGAHWSTQYAGNNTMLSAVSFPDASHGWVVGTDPAGGGHILATSDGGAAWKVQSLGTTESLSDVSFPDASHGCAVGYHGAIVTTSNGGATWTPQDSGTALDLGGVCFADASHGWAVGGVGVYDTHTAKDGSVILVTVDGGATWTLQRSGVGESLQAVTFTDATHGWAVGGDDQSGTEGRGVIVATSDGGATWTAQSSRTWPSFSAVSFPDARHGWVESITIDMSSGDSVDWRYSAVILATADGGATWAQQYLDQWPYNEEPVGEAEPWPGPASVTFPDTSHGWAWTGIAFLATSDGGAHWTRLNTYGGKALLFLDASHGWAADQNGTISATSDGGATWTKQSSGTTAYLTAVSFPDASHGWAVGSDGVILATRTGGRPDRIPPTTTIGGADDLWHNAPVVLTLSATDNPGGSGVVATCYQIDGGPWVEGTTSTIPAPADHSYDGTHTVSYYSTDFSGNIEPARSVTVKIETTKPVISVAYLGFLRHRAHAGWGNHTSRFGLTYRIDDNLSPTAMVTLEALNWRGKVVKSTSLGECPTGVLHTCPLQFNLSLLFCRWRVTATDLAGNTQSRLADFRLFMRF